MQDTSSSCVWWSLDTHTQFLQVFDQTWYCIPKCIVYFHCKTNSYHQLRILTRSVLGRRSAQGRLFLYPVKESSCDIMRQWYCQWKTCSVWFYKIWKHKPNIEITLSGTYTFCQDRQNDNNKVNKSSKATIHVLYQTIYTCSGWHNSRLIQCLGFIFSGNIGTLDIPACTVKPV